MLVTSRALQECDKWMINRRLGETNQPEGGARLLIHVKAPKVQIIVVAES